VDPWPGGVPTEHPAVGLASLERGGGPDAPARAPVAATSGAADAVRWQRGLFQLVVLLWAYALYDVLRSSVTGSVATATAHAHQVLAVERFVGLDFERFIQRAALHWPWLVGACNLCYTLTHLAAPPLVLWLLYRRAPATYRYWRNVFLVLLALGVLCFWLFPTAPPRLTPGSGLVTTSHGFSHTPLAPLEPTSGVPIAEMNPFAAMPSLHVGWAVWAALALWPLARRWWTRLLVVQYPAAMLVSVVVTGNHWTLDAGVGVAATLLACGLVSALTGMAPRRTLRPDPKPAVVTVGRDEGARGPLGSVHAHAASRA
jgi:hypothetical protein